MSGVPNTIPQGKFDYPYQYTIEDKRRAAFDLGWEYRRRGRPIEDNPFHPETEKWQWFREGCRAFKDQDLRKYHNLKSVSR